MPYLPARPDLAQLRHQAKDLSRTRMPATTRPSRVFGQSLVD